MSDTVGCWVCVGSGAELLQISSLYHSMTGFEEEVSQQRTLCHTRLGLRHASVTVLYPQPHGAEAVVEEGGGLWREGAEAAAVSPHKPNRFVEPCDSVNVSRLLSIEKHPDRLSICVQDGWTQEPGALFNCETSGGQPPIPPSSFPNPPQDSSTGFLHSVTISADAALPFP